MLRHRTLVLAETSVSYRNVVKVSTQRPFTSTLPAKVEAKDISPSASEDADTLAKQVTELVDNGKWNLCYDGEGLERAFKFKTFKATWDFMNSVAAEAKAQRHHPEWANIYTRTTICWTTHNPEGLSAKDIAMARFCDEAAKRHGEVPVEREEGEAPTGVGEREALL